jgi:hypothetical protein
MSGDIPGRGQRVVNVKAAKAIGLTIPPTVVGPADEVIE